MNGKDEGGKERGDESVQRPWPDDAAIKVGE